MKLINQSWCTWCHVVWRDCYNIGIVFNVWNECIDFSMWFIVQLWMLCVCIVWCMGIGVQFSSSKLSFCRLEIDCWSCLCAMHKYFRPFRVEKEARTNNQQYWSPINISYKQCLFILSSSIVYLQATRIISRFFFLLPSFFFQMNTATIHNTFMH